MLKRLSACYSELQRMQDSVLHSSLKKFKESEFLFSKQIILWKIFWCQEVAKFITSLQSKFCHLKHCCCYVSAVCLFLWIVDSLHTKMLATEQRVNITFFVLLYKSSSETLQMLEKVYGKAVLNYTNLLQRHYKCLKKCMVRQY
jgi:hypothetical protein